MYAAIVHSNLFTQIHTANFATSQSQKRKRKRKRKTFIHTHIHNFQDRVNDIHVRFVQ